jgi:hypothetical protein
MMILAVQELSHPWGQKRRGGNPVSVHDFLNISHEIADSGSMNDTAPDVAPRGGSVTKNSKKPCLQNASERP